MKIPYCNLSGKRLSGKVIVRETSVKLQGRRIRNLAVMVRRRRSRTQSVLVFPFAVNFPAGEIPLGAFAHGSENNEEQKFQENVHFITTYSRMLESIRLYTQAIVIYMQIRPVVWLTYKFGGPGTLKKFGALL